MKTYTKSELDEIVQLHQLWLRGEGGQRANLSGSDLNWSDLRGSDLRESDLSGSDLRGSDLSGSDLSWSDLSGSDLRWSDLRESDLSGSDLRGSDLRESDLSGSDLSGSDLRGSSLSGSNLQQSIGIMSAQVAFSGHGECGRMLTAITIDGSVKYFCGCFSGSYHELIKYITDRADELYDSRLIAARCCKMMLDVSIERASK